MRSALVHTFLFLMLAAAGNLCAGALRISGEVRGANNSLGITWVSITVNNPTSRPIKGQFDFISYGGGSGMSHTYLDLASVRPGETRTLNVAAPIISSALLTEADGDRTPLNLNVYGSNDNRREMLFVSDSDNLLTGDELDDFTRRVVPGLAGGGMMTASMSGMGVTSGRTTRTLMESERVLTQMAAEDLPENWLCYVPLKYLIMSDDVERRITAPQRQALDTWLNLGGSLVLYESENTGASSVGRGRIIRREDNPVTDPTYSPDMSTNAFPVKQRLDNVSRPYRSESTGGRGGALFLTTMFLIVAGPLNYFYFLRKGEIRKLIVTVPLISLGFCSLIFGYFILTQGFNRKGGSISITTVDESSNRAVTFATHSLLSGLYPGGGFHFDSKTYFQPITNSEKGNVVMDLTREIVLKQGLFQPGRPFDYMTVLPYTTRERMIYDTASNELRNGFELPARAVAVLHNGQYYTGGAVPSGGSVKLTPTDPADMSNESTAYGAEHVRLAKLVGRQQLETAELTAVSEMTRAIMDYPHKTTGTIYMAIFDGTPKGSEAGVEISDGKNLHLVIGHGADEGAQP